MQAFLDERLRVPAESVEKHHLTPFCYDLIDSFSKERYRIETYERHCDHYSFPRGNLQKLRQVFNQFRFDDQRKSVPFPYRLRFTGRLYDEQKALVSRWIDRGYGMIQAPARSGKCVVGSSLILTTRGIVPIERLGVGTSIESGTGLSFVSDFHKRQSQTTLKLRTHCGYEVHGTPEHPVLVIDRQLQMQWMPLDQVVPGEHRIAVALGTDVWATDAPALPVIDPSTQYHTTNIYPTPRRVTPELARLLGYLVGEGSLRYRASRVTNKDEDLLTDFRHCLRSCFGATATETIDKRNEVQNVGVDSVYLRDFLSACGLQLELSAGQQVPSCIMQAPRSSVVQFLRAYFDADGTGSKDDIETISASETLVKQIQLLLLNLGIVARRTVRNIASPHSGVVRPYHRLLIHGVDIQRFHARIGFGLARKNTYRERSRKHDRAAVLPFVGAAICRLAKRGRFGWYRMVDGTKKQIRLARTVDHGRVDETSADEFAQDPDLLARIGMIDLEMAGRIEALLQRRHFWDDVDLIEDGGEQTVYDITVPVKHSFVANGLVVHNTVMMTSILCKMRQRTLMLAHLEDLCHQLEETIRKFTNVDELEEQEGRRLVGVLEEWDDFFPIATLSTYQCFAVSPRGRDVLVQHRDDFGLVMVDESHRCFVAGTLIDDTLIENVRVGDYVNSYDHRNGRITKSRVTDTMVSKANCVLVLTCESGRVLVTTMNHPFWDGEKYRQACSFHQGDWLYGTTGPENLRGLRRSLPTADLVQQDQCGPVLERMCAETARCEGQEIGCAVCDMRSIGGVQRKGAASHIADDSPSGSCYMLGRMPTSPDETEPGTADQKIRSVLERIQPQTCACSHDSKQPDAVRECATEGFHEAQEDKTQAVSTGRQRSRSDRTAAKAGRCFRMENGACDPNQDASTRAVSDLLQSGHCERREKDSDRDRWFQSLQPREASSGPQKGSVLAIDRVASIKIYKQGCDEQFERLCPGGRVYNFTVEPNNNYFANGILVHNCKTELFREVVERTTATYRCGVTATPVRKDGMHVVVADTLGPVVAVGSGEQLPVRYTWEHTGIEVKEFANWGVMWNRLVKFKTRDKQIAQKIVHDVRDGHYVLVTTERLKHLDDLMLAIQKIDPDITVGLLSGKTKDREGFRAAAKRGDYQVVIAMNKIVELGYNIPRWSCFHNTLPMTNPQNWYQRISRIRTPMEPAFAGDDWEKPPPLARIWIDTGHRCCQAYRNIVQKENDRLGFECLNPYQKRQSGRRKGITGYQKEGAGT